MPGSGAPFISQASRVFSSSALASGTERITGAAVAIMPGSPPCPATCAAPDFSPAAFSTSARRTPVHFGQPMPPVWPHGVPLAAGR